MGGSRGKTFTVNLDPSGTTFRVPGGTMLSDALRERFPDILFPCGGLGLCGRCRMDLVDGSSASNVLACRTVVDRDLNVVMPPDLTRDPLTTEVLRSYEPAIHDPAGLAVDLGTTTISLSIISLATGDLLARGSASNPQAAFGADVISRIYYAGSGPGNLQALKNAAIGGIRRILEKLLPEMSLNPERIGEAVIAGNTCMEHLVAGVDPAPLGVQPYRPAFEGGIVAGADVVDLGIRPGAKIYIPPVISGFLGADISAGLLACGLRDRKENVLFIDVGTNGEIVLKSGDRFIAASAAAGPAFEGVGIAHGMRAGVGAIERVEVAGGLRVEVIGGGDPEGLCGTGIISAAAALRRSGMMNPSGLLLLPDEWPAGVRAEAVDTYFEKDGIRGIRLAGDVTVDQKDIRTLQLAKSAIGSAVDLLLDEAGLAADDVEEVLVAGAFGRRLDGRDAAIAGLVPSDLTDRFAFVGNTSRQGAEILLRDHGSREWLAEYCDGRIEVVELQGHAAFEETFIRNLGFPDDAEVELIQAKEGGKK